MRAAFAIANKELRVFLTTPTAYALLGGFQFVTAALFSLLVHEYQQQRFVYGRMKAALVLDEMNLTDLVVGPMLGSISTLLIFIVPVLTMRQLAEERRSHTIDFLLSLPLRPWQIVMGKFSACWLLMTLMVLLTLPNLWLLELNQSADAPPALDWQTVAVGYVGVWLFGSTAVAIGLCCSAVSESQLTASILGFAMLLVLMLVGGAVRGNDDPVSQVLAYLCFDAHLQAFARGLIRLETFVYFISLLWLALFGTSRIIAVHRLG